jgi:Spy/CpxP family protein refolding chaperone
MFSGLNAQVSEKVEVKKVEATEEKHENHMEEELELTEEQKTQMNAIKEKYAAKEKAQKDQMRALKQSMKELREAKRKEMHSVLTPEQKKKADAHHATMMKKKKAKTTVKKQKMQQRKEMNK